eukprot:Rmarinus@m.25576
MSAIIESREFLGQLFANMYELYLQDHLCDTSIYVNEMDHIRAHSVVIASASDFFREALVADDLESGSDGDSDAKDSSIVQQEHSVHVSGTDLDTVELLLDFIYLGKVEITVETTLRLACLANQLQMPNLTLACERFVYNSLNIENCLKFADEALALGRFALSADLSQRVYDEAFQWAEDRFPELVASGQIIFASMELCTALLQSDELQVSSEDEVWLGAKAWLEGDEGRGFDPHTVRSILLSVRLRHVSPSTLEEIQRHPSIIVHKKMFDEMLQEIQSESEHNRQSQGPRKRIRSTETGNAPFEDEIAEKSSPRSDSSNKNSESPQLASQSHSKPRAQPQSQTPTLVHTHTPTALRVPRYHGRNDDESGVRHITTMRGHTAAVEALLPLSPYGAEEGTCDVLVSGSHDATLRIWDTQTWTSPLSVSTNQDGHSFRVTSLSSCVLDPSAPPLTLDPTRSLSPSSPGPQSPTQLHPESTCTPSPATHVPSVRVASVYFSAGLDSTVRLWALGFADSPSQALTHSNSDQGYTSPHARAPLAGPNIFSPDGVSDLRRSRSSSDALVPSTRSTWHVHCQGVAHVPFLPYCLQKSRVHSIYTESFHEMISDTPPMAPKLRAPDFSSPGGNISYERKVENEFDREAFHTAAVVVAGEGGYPFFLQWSDFYNPRGKEGASGAKKRDIPCGEITKWTLSMTEMGDGSVFCGNSDGSLEWWDADGTNKSGFRSVAHVPSAHAGPVRATCLTGSVVAASAGNDGIVRLWDSRKSGSAVREIVAHSGPVRSLLWDARANCIVSGGLDGRVRVWDTGTGNSLHTIGLPPTASVHSMASIPSPSLGQSVSQIAIGEGTIGETLPSSEAGHYGVRVYQFI